MIALSKTIESSDFEELVPELHLVDKHFTREREQHPMRRWEYALALRALTEWRFESHRTEHVVYDIGGAGSPFTWMVPTIAAVIDPEHDVAGGFGEKATLEQFVRMNPRLADAVFCMSVIEHVADLEPFLWYLTCLLAPGGLLFLTMDACGCGVAHGGQDSHHFNWMRKRIFSNGERRNVWTILRGCDMTSLGIYDPRWHGDHVYDYSFASLAMVKRQ